MPKPHARSYAETSTAKAMAAYLAERNDELLDAIVAAAAFVAKIDGRIDPAERSRLLEFLSGNGFLCAFTREEILEAFARRLGEAEVGEPDGEAHALEDLAPIVGHSSARMVVQASEAIAKADGYLDARELHALNRIRWLLGHPAPSHPQTTRRSR